MVVAAKDAGLIGAPRFPCPTHRADNAVLSLSFEPTQSSTDARNGLITFGGPSALVGPR